MLRDATRTVCAAQARLVGLRVQRPATRQDLAWLVIRPSDLAQPRAELSGINRDAFRSYDEEFFALNDALHVDTVIETYIEEHPDEFFR